MANKGKEIVAATLRLAHSVRIHRVLGDAAAGRGVIFMLHKVGAHGPGTPGAMTYPPNEDLIVTPTFLGELIERVRSLDYDIISLDDALDRLGQSSARRFAVFTLDDAYRDTLETAYPVMRAAGAPFTVYVPTSWADGRGAIKWAVLEAMAATGVAITPNIDGLPARLDTETAQQRASAVGCLDRYLSGLGPFELARTLRAMADLHGIDVDRICRDQIMTWNEIRWLARDDLVTIGAHSVDHVDFSLLRTGQLYHQLSASKSRIEAELGEPCRHFSYPYGGAEVVGPREIAHTIAAGFATAVTTWRGVVSDRHRVRLTALPRIAVSGRMEDLRCMEMLISGVPDMVLGCMTNRVA